MIHLPLVRLLLFFHYCALPSWVWMWWCLEGHWGTSGDAWGHAGQGVRSGTWTCQEYVRLLVHCSVTRREAAVGRRPQVLSEVWNQCPTTVMHFSFVGSFQGLPGWLCPLTGQLVLSECAGCCSALRWSVVPRRLPSASMLLLASPPVRSRLGVLRYVCVSGFCFAFSNTGSHFVVAAPHLSVLWEPLGAGD